jgi:RNA polymerase sigma-70 factor, ECF subfamily
MLMWGDVFRDRGRPPVHTQQGGYRVSEGPGSDQALRALYDTHGSALLRYLMRLTKGDRHKAEDLVQETLIRAWQHPQARVNGEWSRPWLFMVARRIAIDHFRATLARPAEVHDERLHDRPETDAGFDRITSRTAILEAVLELPAKYRDVLIEIYFRDQPVAKAAEILGVPEGTVKSRSFYALRALRQRYIEKGLLPRDLS